jgi:hypothetical protein
MAAKGRIRPDPDGTWVAQKYGHAGETNWCGHHVRRPASGQFSASQVDTNFENLQRRLIISVDPADVGLIDAGRAYPCWGLPDGGRPMADRHVRF